MIEAYYNALGKFFNDNIKHPETGQPVAVSVAGGDREISSEDYPAIVIKKLVDSSIDTTHPNFLPEEKYDPQTNESGEFVGLNIVKNEIPVQITTQVELFSLDSVIDIRLLSAMLRLFGRQRFTITAKLEDERTVDFISEVSEAKDMSTKGNLGNTPSYSEYFRRIWTLKAMVHLTVPKDELPTIGNPVTQPVVTDIDLME